MLYTTFQSVNDAKIIVKQMLKDKVISCANIIPNVHSMYYWNDDIMCETECIVIMKSINIKHAATILKSKHSYVTPCIAVFENITFDDDFMKWMRTACER